MDQAAAGATAGYVEDSAYTGADKIVVGGKTYRPYVASTDSEKTIYVYQRQNKSYHTVSDHLISHAFSGYKSVCGLAGGRI